MWKSICVAVLLAVVVTAPASAQVGHRVESLVVPGSTQGEPRKVKVHLWYPAPTAAHVAAPPTVYTSTLHGRALLPEWDPMAWSVDAQLARDTAAISTTGEPFPVIVFSHGSTNNPIDYAWTLEAIAAAGFVVAAPYHVNNSQDDVRIDYINTQAGARGPLFACEDGRPSPCSRLDNARSVDDRVRDVSAILDAVPGWFGARADVAKAGVLGHSRGTITALAAAGGSTQWGFGPDRRVQAIMGLAIGLRPLRNPLNLAAVTVPTLLVAGGKDRNSEPAISEEAIATIASADKRFVTIPDATHRSFDSTYCAQLQSAATIAYTNPRAILDRHLLPLIGASGPGGNSGKAVHYCHARYLTPPVIELLKATPGTEYPPALNDVCSTTEIPCTGLDTEAVSEQVTALAVEFFRSRLARADSGEVSGSVSATLALALDGGAAFDPFIPGVAQEYTATSGATVTSTAGDATLSVSDPGHLTNGAFRLPQPLRVELAPAAWTGPVSGGRVAITFRQAIGAGDALRTGSYSRTLTFTLSTTSP